MNAINVDDLIIIAKHMDNAFAELSKYKKVSKDEFVINIVSDKNSIFLLDRELYNLSKSGEGHMPPINGVEVTILGFKFFIGEKEEDYNV